MNFYIVDDDPDVLTILSRMLEEAGHRVEASPSSLAALKQIPMSRPDCVITDLMMPEMDGFAFAAEVRRHPEWRSIPIVVVTAQDLTNDDRRRLNGHVETIIRKSGDSRDSLLEQVRDLLADSNAVRVPRERVETSPT